MCAVLFYTGNAVEGKCGSLYFLLMLLLFAPCCSLVLIVFNKALADIVDPVYVTQCYYGMSCKGVFSYSLILTLLSLPSVQLHALVLPKLIYHRPTSFRNQRLNLETSGCDYSHVHSFIMSSLLYYVCPALCTHGMC